MNKPLRVVSVTISEAYPPRDVENGCAVVQVQVNDGREFSLLTATPSWFEKAFSELGLSYYFGPSILFVERLELAVVKRAVRAMASEGDRWFCLYDTPRITLPELLSRFKERHFDPATR